MAKNITLLGAEYSDVPFVNLPQTGGGLATFRDVSDTTITANPEITVSNTGLITAEVSTEQNVTPVVTSGYVDTGVAGAVSVSGSKTKQLATQAATTITPGTTPQTIPAETYLTGAVTVAGDANLVGSNIVANHSIFGVNGEVELVSVTQDPITKGLTIS